MGKRRESREAAVQFLFQHDLSKGGAEEEPLDRLLERFWELRPAAVKTRDFGAALAKGVLENQADIDERIRKFATNYELNRIAAVDRNILRVAVYEMVFSSDVPPVVSINEAIEIAKRFGSEDSGRFVNGILDRIKGELSRPAR
jgi:N utilization substance protein B